MIARRDFLIGLAGLISLPSIPNIISTASGSTLPLVFLADMEVHQFSDYSENGGPSINAMGSSGNSPEISIEQARKGSRSLKFVLNREKSPNSYRTEVTTRKRQLEFFKTTWVGFSMFVPSDWEVSNTWEVFLQIAHEPADWDAYLANGGGFNPILGIRLAPASDQHLIVQNYVQTPEDLHQPSDRKRAFSTTLSGKLAQGQWTDWVLEYRPDWRSVADGGKGVTRFWRNGELVIDYYGPNAVNATYAPFIKFGTYKSAWSDRSHSDPVKERIYYFDEFRVSRPNEGSYELVAPGSQKNDNPSPPTEPDDVKAE